MARGELSELQAQRLAALGLGGVETRDAAWWRRYRDLQAFRDARGHVQVPLRTDPALRMWVYMQKRRWEVGRLSPERVRALERLGVHWSDEELLWRKHYSVLCQFEREHGHTYVPSALGPYRGLWSWVGRQRLARSEGRLEAARASLLDAIGFDWDDERAQWETGVRALEQAGGLGRMRSAWIRHVWVPRQRELVRRGLLPADRVARLQSLGVLGVAPRQNRSKVWERRFRELQAFREEHGDFRVPSQKPWRLLHGWVMTQRNRHKRRMLSAPKVEALESIGFPWSARAGSSAGPGRVQQAKWEARVAELEAFHAQHGDFRVPPGEPWAKLHRWILVQRRNACRGKLSDARLARLRSIGCDPANLRLPGSSRVRAGGGPQAEPSRVLRGTLPDAVGLRGLEAFVRAFGHAAVPVRGRWRALNRWARKQVRMAKAGHLSEDRRASLARLGLLDAQGKASVRLEDGRAVRWDECFSQLQAFQASHGHVEVSRVCGEDSDLASWLSRQRGLWRRGRLSAERVERLRGLGVEADVRVVVRGPNRRWMVGYEQLRRFVEEQGHADPSVAEAPRRLVEWVRVQRRRARVGELSPEQRALLESLGVSFECKPRHDYRSKYRESWERRWEELRDVRDRCGHLRVEELGPAYEDLCRWMSAQRSRRNLGLLPKERCKQLESLGFDWRSGARRREHAPSR